MAWMMILPVPRSDYRYIFPPMHYLRSFTQIVVVVAHTAIGLVSLPVLGVLRHLSAYRVVPHHVPNTLAARSARMFGPVPARIATWRGREQAATLTSALELDVDMIVTSYSSAVDLDRVVERAAAALIAAALCAKSIDVFERIYPVLF